MPFSLWHEKQPEAHTVDQIWDIIVNSITEVANICLPKKRLQYSINNRRRQKKEKKSKTYKAIVQLSKWIRKEKKNQNQKIDTAFREEMILSIREINKKLNWMILSQKDKADKNQAKLKEIQERINDRCEMIDEKQGKMLASLLNKPFNKFKIDKLVKENGLQRSLLLKRDKILAHTKEHFSSQFKEKSLNLEEMPGK
ncbi:42137_t:CDS:2 [Gigaspora margarita]|uniref:42137_t:CDS:1 n=1 Tax=Gigaspora margarita TaxID=4874 RepID=A0ABN7UUT2_GIGMA|nr:42137_t:CDS:2 [Gigaspora margarita]